MLHSACDQGCCNCFDWVGKVFKQLALVHRTYNTVSSWGRRKATTVLDPVDRAKWEADADIEAQHTSKATAKVWQALCPASRLRLGKGMHDWLCMLVR